MKWLSWLSIAVIVSACTSPKTAEEFKQKLPSDLKKTTMVNRPFDQVIADVTRHFPCYQKTIKTKYYNQKGMQTMGLTAKLYASWVKEQPGFKTMVIRDDGSITNKPEGGALLFVADFTSVSKQATKVETYNLMWDQTGADIVPVAKGEISGCR